MHISEGIISGTPVLGYTAAGLSLLLWGTKRMKRFSAHNPEIKPLLGMGGAFIFFLSLIPIPSFTGTCSHPCGSPLIAILLGPSIGIALTGISLLLQAAFFAHGGFSTWGTNLIALGLCGCLFGWGAFKIGQKLGLPIWLAAALGGLLGDIMVYLASGLILGYTLAHAPHPRYSLSGYLAAIYLAYLPVQGPIALAEMILTGLVMHNIYQQRPEVLENLKIVSAKNAFAPVVIWLVCVFCLFPLKTNQAQAFQQDTLSGMDEAVNETLAEDAGATPQSPLLDTESMGDLWNTVLLSAGGVCGFVIGRYWHLIGKKRGA